MMKLGRGKPGIFIPDPVLETPKRVHRNIEMPERGT